MSETVVIIGAGQAGGDMTTALRQQGFEGRIVLIGEEPALPYRRPPLSKAYLSGEMSEAQLYIKPASTYEKQNVDVKTGVRVESIDRAAHTVTLDTGEVIEYTKLAFCTGGHARRLPLAGAEKPNVHYVRTIADIERLKAQFQPGKRLLIIGGGYIGLEAAAVGIKKELNVTLVEALPRLLARVTGPELSEYYYGVHSAKGVDIKLGAGVEALEGGDTVETVVLADGARLQADVIIVGIGLIPNTELAEAAGLDVDNGILVDLQCRSSDPDIFAAGDCANHDHGFLLRRIRLESVPNASEGARVIAATICGKEAQHNGAPWFWSDQYDLKLQMVGINQGYEEVVIRGSMEDNNFSAFYLANGVIISADTVNRPKDFMIAKKLVAGRVKSDAATLSDETVDLKSLLG
ncbi:NAD(P)/FAD-dependent oxidoreductase [Litorivivens sp.]|uniref:NAD(P)/FAD-dependent oxidoreductase n=1 Tax=Litorivivens sp. TaxID=2020868 RepID=UPI0035651176